MRGFSEEGGNGEHGYGTKIDGRRDQDQVEGRKMQAGKQ